MKKIICMLAMALLAIGAAQAQNQVRKMVVRTDDGQLVKFKTANTEEVTFEEDAVPTTVDEAKAMLVGYWKCNDLFLGYYFMEVYDYYCSFEGTSYFIVTEDHEVFLAFKIVDPCPFESFAEYAGKIVAVFQLAGGDITVNSEDPTTGDFIRDEWSEFERQTMTFKNLDQNSFDAQWEDYHMVEPGYEYNKDIKIDGTFYRVEPFEYIIPDYGLMKNGLMKK